jgi:hypothetical protein
VAAVSATDAWAVGYNSIYRWNGAAWQPVPFETTTVTATPTGVSFNAVAAAGPNSAWVVGEQVPTPPFFPVSVVEHWDGTAWRLIGSSNVTGAGGHPEAFTAVNSAIAALGPDEAYMVGYAGAYPSITGFLDRCSGSNCNELGSLGNSYFNDVAPVAANDIWVVGYTSPAIGSAFIAHWDGTTLSQTLTLPGYAGLSGVAAASAADVWAVGYTTDTVTSHNLIVHWDGQSWTPVSSPDIGGLSGVDVRAANDAWAVGAGGILHWDGSAWQVVASPAGAQAVSAQTAEDVWAVGGTYGGAPAIQHYAVPLRFADVPLVQPFYPYIQGLACRGLISGYTCGGPGEPCFAPDNLPYFRAGAHVTRGQLVKMILSATGWPLLNPPNTQRTFEDVPSDQPFYTYIETAAAHSIISGYTCGGPGEPCGTPPRPYFRPGANITRGQIAKVLAEARTLPAPSPPTATFADVPPAHPFYSYIEAVAAAGIVSGYTCGGPGEPCDSAHRPYFRPAANATRAQTTKFVANGFFPP